MKNLLCFRLYILTFFIMLVCSTTKSQDRVMVNVPTADSEAEYIWQTIQDIEFFEEHKYQIGLPSGLLIDNLKDKARSQSLTGDDYELLRKFVNDSVYNIVDYQKGFEKINNELGLINKLIKEIDPSEYAWNYKSFKTYQVNLSLYGPGGSYDPDGGSILIYTTAEGNFKNDDHPANIIIHEVTHIGIQEAIINKYNVPHAMKERIVDTFVFLNFSEDLPAYRIQNMGETRPDLYLKSKKDLKNLDSFMEKMMSE